MASGKERQPPPTLADVARLAHVSTMTASRALRNVGECHPETRKRVLQAAEELGYRANPIVSLFQSMVRRKPGGYKATIGWISDFGRRGYHRSTLWELPYWEGARERAAALGFVLEEIWLGEDARRDTSTLAARAQRILRTRGIPAVILPFMNNTRLARADWSEFAVAAIGPLYPDPKDTDGLIESFSERYHHVQPDAFANVQLAIKRLGERGYRRIGFMLSSWHNRETGRQLEGGYLACQQDMAPADRLPVWWDDAGMEAVPSLRQWLIDWKPDCVLCCKNEARAMLEAAGWIVPQDIGLAHISHAEDVHNWSGIDPGHRRLAAAAVDLVIQQMQAGEAGYPDKPIRLSILGDWVAGETTR